MNDLRFAIRLLAKNPGFTAVAVLTLALGIGANSALFSVVYAVLIKPLPYPEPERLVQVQSTISAPGKPAFTFPEWAYPRFELLRDQNRAFAQVVACASGEVTVTDGGDPERLKTEQVSAGYFALLGLRPARGRFFVAEEDQRARSQPVAVISDGLWRRRFGAEPGVLGKVIRANKVALTIVGVMPRGFGGQSGSAELWVPITMVPALDGDPDRLNRPGTMWHRVLARLSPGTSLAGAQAALAAVEKQIEAVYPPRKDAGTWNLKVVPLQAALTDPDISRSLRVLMAAVGFVLLIACVNVGNLLFARAASREGEIAVRLALGATRGRLVRQLLLESLVLAAVAGALALILARWSVDLLAAFQPVDNYSFFSANTILPEFGAIRLTPAVLVFNFIVALGCALLCGLLPAWQATRKPLNPACHRASGSPAGEWGGLRLLGGRSALVVGETALALVLLIGAGLMVHSFARLTRTKIGFDPANLLTLRLDKPRGLSGEAGTVFIQQVLERVGALPGVESACLANATPLSGTFDRSVALAKPSGPDGGRGEFPVGIHHASAGYLGTLRVSLLRGRWLSEQDRGGGKKVAVINETAARRHWPAQDPIGQKLDLSLAIAPEYADVEIVGVVGDLKYDKMDAEIGADVYLSYQQADYPGYYLTLRTTVEPLQTVGAVRQVVAGLDPSLPLYDVMTMRQRIANSLSRMEFNTLLLTGFALLAVVLATIGVYGLVAYSVGQRTREIGIRMALGARVSGIMQLVLWQGLRLVLVGSLIGLAAALGLTRFLRSLLYEVKPADPLTFASVTLLLGLAALLACWVPARRAARTDPVAALRYE